MMLIKKLHKITNSLIVREYLFIFSQVQKIYSFNIQIQLVRLIINSYSVSLEYLIHSVSVLNIDNKVKLLQLPCHEVLRLNIRVGLKQYHQSVTEIMFLIIMNSVTPKVGAKYELLFNKPVSVAQPSEAPIGASLLKLLQNLNCK